MDQFRQEIDASLTRLVRGMASGDSSDLSVALEGYGQAARFLPSDLADSMARGHKKLSLEQKAEPGAARSRDRTDAIDPRLTLQFLLGYGAARGYAGQGGGMRDQAYSDLKTRVLSDANRAREYAPGDVMLLGLEAGARGDTKAVCEGFLSLGKPYSAIAPALEQPRMADVVPIERGKPQGARPARDGQPQVRYAAAGRL